MKNGFPSHVSFLGSFAHVHITSLLGITSIIAGDIDRDSLKNLPAETKVWIQNGQSSLLGRMGLTIGRNASYADTSDLVQDFDKETRVSYEGIKVYRFSITNPQTGEIKRYLTLRDARDFEIARYSENRTAFTNMLL